jgi:hypothetical protein
MVEWDSANARDALKAPWAAINQDMSLMSAETVSIVSMSVLVPCGSEVEQYDIYLASFPLRSVSGRNIAPARRHSRCVGVSNRQAKRSGR